MRIKVDVDSLPGTKFQKRVWKELLKIPSGTTVTYKEISRRIGKPKAIRAVANAIGANPLPVAIPCHRVIRSDGKIGGYSLGINKKLILLRKEGSIG